MTTPNKVGVTLLLLAIVLITMTYTAAGISLISSVNHSVYSCIISITSGNVLNCGG